MRFPQCALVMLGISAVAAPVLGAEILITSFNTNRVGRYMPDHTFIGLLDPVGGMQHPLCTRLGPDGNLYVASESTNSIQRYNAATGAFIDTFVTPSSGGLFSPTGITWDTVGNLYVAGFASNNVLKYNGTTGAFISTFIAPGAGGVGGPDNGTIFGPDGNLYVPSYNTNQILKYNGADGSFMSVFASIGRPRVLEFRNNVLYVTSETGNSVRRFDATTGAPMTDFVTGLNVPIGLAFGNDGFLYVSSSAINRVNRYDETTGAFVSSFVSGSGGAGGISLPAFITVIPAPSGAALLFIGAAAQLRRRR